MTSAKGAGSLGTVARSAHSTSYQAAHIRECMSESFRSQCLHEVISRSTYRRMHITQLLKPLLAWRHMPHNVKHSMLQKQCIKSIVDIQDGCQWVASEATSPYSTYIVNAYDSEITSEASHVRSKIPQFPTTHIVTLTQRSRTNN